MNTSMIRRAVSFVLLAPVVLLMACHGQGKTTRPVGAATTARNQGYALLYSTIKNEAAVDKVLTIKDPSPHVANLVKAIGQFSRDAKTRLEAFAKEDPTLSLYDQGLPEVEQRTRAAISSATSKQIIWNGGKGFEFRILLTQHDALNYITHLATTLSQQDTHPARRTYLAKLAVDSNALHELVLGQLGGPYVGRPQ